MNDTSRPDLPARHDGSLAAAVQPDNVDVGLIALVGVFAAVVLVVILVLLEAWFYTWRQDLAAERNASPPAFESPLDQMLAEQQQQLDGYRWIDRKTNVRAIPIPRAMQLVAAEMAVAQKTGTAATTGKTPEKPGKRGKP
jgi:hypothetical protein